MQVEMWADIVCSWCGIANKRVKAAVAAFEHADEVTFVHRSFRLLAGDAEGTSRTLTEYFASRGMSDAQMRQATEHVERIAAADGFREYHVLDNRIGDTTLAHEFLAFASDHGAHAAAWDLLLEAHFADQADLWTVDDLLHFTEPLGLDPVEATAALTSRRYRDQVVAEHERLVAYGSSGVPFLVIDGRYALAGAQPTADITAALVRAWDERSNA